MAKFSAPPSDILREVPLVKLFPCKEARAVLLERGLSLSSKNLKRE